MSAPRAGLALLVLGLCAAGGAAAKAEAESDNFLKAGAGLRTHHSALRDQMRKMMVDDEDDVNFHQLSRNGHDTSGRSALQSSGPSAGTASLEDYIKDSEDGLSAALGPRWNAKTIEEDADHKTAALLRGISGPKATRAINRMMGILRWQRRQCGQTEA